MLTSDLDTRSKITVLTFKVSAAKMLRYGVIRLLKFHLLSSVILSLFKN